MILDSGAPAARRRITTRFSPARDTRCACRTRAIVVPRLGHFGFVALHNEKIVYCWPKALEADFSASDGFGRGAACRSRAKHF